MEQQACVNGDNQGSESRESHLWKEKENLGSFREMSEDAQPKRNREMTREKKDQRGSWRGRCCSYIRGILLKEER